MIRDKPRTQKTVRLHAQEIGFKIERIRPVQVQIEIVQADPAHRLGDVSGFLQVRLAAPAAFISQLLRHSANKSALLDFVQLFRHLCFHPWGLLFKIRSRFSVNHFTPSSRLLCSIKTKPKESGGHRSMGDASWHGTTRLSPRRTQKSGGPAPCGTLLFCRKITTEFLARRLVYSLHRLTFRPGLLVFRVKFV